MIHGKILFLALKMMTESLLFVSNEKYFVENYNTKRFIKSITNVADTYFVAVEFYWLQILLYYLINRKNFPMFLMKIIYSTIDVASIQNKKPFVFLIDFSPS